MSGKKRVPVRRALLEEKPKTTWRDKKVMRNRRKGSKTKYPKPGASEAEEAEEAEAPFSLPHSFFRSLRSATYSAAKSAARAAMKNPRNTMAMAAAAGSMMSPSFGIIIGAGTILTNLLTKIGNNLFEKIGTMNREERLNTNLQEYSAQIKVILDFMNNPFNLEGDANNILDTIKKLETTIRVTLKQSLFGESKLNTIDDATQILIDDVKLVIQILRELCDAYREKEKHRGDFIRIFSPFLMGQNIDTTYVNVVTSKINHPFVRANQKVEDKMENVFSIWGKLTSNDGGKSINFYNTDDVKKKTSSRFFELYSNWHEDSEIIQRLQGEISEHIRLQDFQFEYPRQGLNALIARGGRLAAAAAAIRNPTVTDWRAFTNAIRELGQIGTGDVIGTYGDKTFTMDHGEDAQYAAARMRFYTETGEPGGSMPGGSMPGGSMPRGSMPRGSIFSNYTESDYSSGSEDSFRSDSSLGGRKKKHRRTRSKGKKNKKKYNKKRKTKKHKSNKKKHKSNKKKHKSHKKKYKFHKRKTHKKK